jgi:hypothetical protein
MTLDARDEERLRRERQKLVEQIRESEQAIERSQQLLKQIDEQLAKSLLEP